jgi:4-aminobutyrate aminotransferase/(S)-3-amino-2-methylpropionate transaminase
MGSIKILTDIPGPRSRELVTRARQIVPSPIGPQGGIFIARAEGAVVEDVDGNCFIDLIGGVGCLMVGHSHPRVIEAIKRQAEVFTHTDFSIVPYESYVELGERISEMAAFSKPAKVAFFSTGAEAVENAVKIARSTTRRPGIIAFEGAFHGRTYMALTMTARDEPYKAGFGPFVPEIYRVPYPSFGGATLEDSLRETTKLFTDHEIAAVIVEPILGEGGFVVPPPNFLSELRKITVSNGSVLIADEVQTGYGRTGRFLASQHANTEPDIVVLGKSIGAGLPLSALVIRNDLVEGMTTNSLGGTFPGNPIACAAALAVLDVIEEEGLLDRAIEIGARLTEGWGELSTAGSIREIRGLGAMIGVEFEDARTAKSLVSEALSRGVMLLTAGKERDVIRHLLPLVITDSQLDEVFEVLGSALRRS